MAIAATPKGFSALSVLSRQAHPFRNLLCATAVIDVARRSVSPRPNGMENPPPVALSDGVGYRARMSMVKDLEQLGKLVADQHGWQAAKAFKAYQMNDADRSALTISAVKLLKVFPEMPGTSALVSAAYAVQLERVLTGPVQVVAGTLTVEGDPVFGDRLDFDGPQIFANGHSDWSGHVWVMVGPYIADVSIFRTAYSGYGPVRLSRHVDRVFGPNKGLYVDHWKRTRQLGLGYEPQYVLSGAEVTALMGGAYRMIQDHRDAAPGAD